MIKNEIILLLKLQEVMLMAKRRTTNEWIGLIEGYKVGVRKQE